MFGLLLGSQSKSNRKNSHARSVSREKRQKTTDESAANAAATKKEKKRATSGSFEGTASVTTSFARGSRYNSYRLTERTSCKEGGKQLAKS